MQISKRKLQIQTSYQFTTKNKPPQIQTSYQFTAKNKPPQHKFWNLIKNGKINECPFRKYFYKLLWKRKQLGV